MCLEEAAANTDTLPLTRKDGCKLRMCLAQVWSYKMHDHPVVGFRFFLSLTLSCAV